MLFVCTKCDRVLDQLEFYKRTESAYRSVCKDCYRSYSAKSDSRQKVSDWRRRCKQRLVAFHGGKCVDCGFIGPPYQFEFDHRDPKEKSFALSKYGKGYDALLEESKKCDLVCVMCHRTRTHKQRCRGCEFCN